MKSNSIAENIKAARDSIASRPDWMKQLAPAIAEYICTKAAGQPASATQRGDV